MSQRKIMNRKKLNKKKLAIFALIIVLVCAGVFLLYDNTGNAQPSMEELKENGIFTEGISIHGANIGGLTYNQGKEKLNPVTDDMVKEYTLTVKLENDNHKINGDDINLDTDMEKQMEEAIKIGNLGTRKQRRNQKKDAKKNGKTFELEYEYDESLLEQNLKTIYSQTGKAAKDASVKMEGGQLVYTEGQNGKAINMEKLTKDVNEVMDKGESNGVVTAEFVEQKPKYTVAMLKEKLVKKSGVSTEFKSSSEDRVTNVVKAANMLNGTMVAPGASFSINKVLGARTEKNGWKIATGISGGKYIDDVGGGVCQVSSTLYKTAVQSGLKITDRVHHMFPVTYLPLGQDAAISTGGPDLQFTNPYDFPIYIVSGASSKNKAIDISIYGPANEDGSSIVFKTEKLSDDAPKSAAKISENANLREGEYVEIKPRKNRIEVKRWLEYIIGGKVTKTVDLSNDIYEAFSGEYIIGKGTKVDEKTGVPSGTKVDEKYLTTKRETTVKTTEATTAAPAPAEQ